jgi:glycosyltransferase involved in cell wall biosynthesis
MSLDPAYRVTVLDMQPIDPPLGGGRMRLLGLYHGLGLPTCYIGSYDWPGEPHREIRLSPTLTEIDVPLGERHFKAGARALQGVRGRTVIDTTFARFARLSPRFVAAAAKAVGEADVVVFSHPWVYPVVQDHLDEENQLIVYDAQNVEGYLRFTLFDDDGGPGTRIVREVVAQEASLVRSAHLVLTCSEEDAHLFHRLYDLPFEKIRTVPNGAFVQDIGLLSPDEKQEARSRLGLDLGTTALFLGSDYEPNLEAVRFITQSLAAQVPEVRFLIAGGVGARWLAESGEAVVPENVCVPGSFSPQEKRVYLGAADMAINPVEKGSGSSIKMFELMAAGLPIITTPAGARGITPGSDEPFRVCPRSEMAVQLRTLSDSPEERSRLSAHARRLAETHYSWEALSGKLGRLLHRHRSRFIQKKPRFSVLVPTYERPAELIRLMDHLFRQNFPDFEVIVVDQSSRACGDRLRPFGLDVFYLHESVRGAVRARNTAAFYARGSILAFTDDDCQPAADWLEKADAYFDDPGVAGLEGLIRTDRLGHPGYRSVSNENFRGIGFMTANLFLRLEVFNTLGGFDERFDNPHFREDTDLGWRALEHGQIPFGFDVQVFHPAHPRDEQRESRTERDRFFEKDALLLKKHPHRFKQLFLAEPANKTAAYWEHFLRGSRKYHVDIPNFYHAYMEKILSGKAAQP